MKNHLTLRTKYFSFLISKKSLFLILFLFILLLVCFTISASLGETFINPFHVIEVLVGKGNAFEQLVVTHFRLPRILIAILVGSSLAVAGAILQGMTRNPLASPDIMGITGGAATAVVLFLTFFSDKDNNLTVSIQWLPLSAFVGATVVALLLYILANHGRNLSPIRLVLIGIGLSAFMKAATTLFMITSPIYRASQANIWITGTVYGSDWQDVNILLPITTVLMLISFLIIRDINIQELGEPIAKSAGNRVHTYRFLFLLICTGLIGSAVAFGGTIGFVGLLAPHISRRLVGSSFGYLLPSSAIMGALLVLLADLVGRTLFLPIEVPAGVFTASIGAPYFVYLLLKQRNQ